MSCRPCLGTTPRIYPITRCAFRRPASGRYMRLAFLAVVLVAAVVAKVIKDQKTLSESELSAQVRIERTISFMSVSFTFEICLSSAAQNADKVSFMFNGGSMTGSATDRVWTSSNSAHRLRKFGVKVSNQGVKQTQSVVKLDLTVSSEFRAFVIFTCRVLARPPWLSLTRLSRKSAAAKSWLPLRPTAQSTTAR